jgi:hypothetical protein
MELDSKFSIENHVEANHICFFSIYIIDKTRITSPNHWRLTHYNPFGGKSK